jgi:hypothetical protein
MSVERHPHINMVGLATDIVCSIREHLRSEEHKNLPFEGLDQAILVFCERVEAIVEWEIYVKDLKEAIAQGRRLSEEEEINARGLGLL